MVAKPPFSNLGHVAVVVRDLDKVIEFYESFGIGPFESPNLINIEFKERRLRGQPIDINSNKVIEKSAKLGPLNIDLLQPVGESFYKDFLDTKGEGIHHLSFGVDDVDKEEAKMVDKGLIVLYKSRYKIGGGVSYLETDKIGGLILELTQWPPEWFSYRRK
jgi:catechol 2,3-dioxygenase-like lactoylglutathione lyase family enzyme